MAIERTTTGGWLLACPAVLSDVIANGCSDIVMTGVMAVKRSITSVSANTDNNETVASKRSAVSSPCGLDAATCSALSPSQG